MTPEQERKLKEDIEKAAREHFGPSYIHAPFALRDIWFGAHLMIERVKPLIEALEFYATYQPYQFPEGYYETHISPGIGGHDKFGTKAKSALEKFYGETK